MAFKDSTFLAQTPTSIIVETSLVALTNISYILPRRVDIVPIFDQTLAESMDFILVENGQLKGLDLHYNILIKARLSLLLGYYADMLFQRYQQTFVKTIIFLIRSASLTGEHKVIAL